MAIRSTCIALVLAVAACGNRSTTSTKAIALAVVAAPAIALQKALDDLDKRTDRVVDGPVADATGAERAAAYARLEALRKQQAELEKQLSHDWFVLLTHRLPPARVTQECLDNPLANGC